MDNIFINHTNHPSSLWTAAELQAAELYGKILDIPFPEIDPEWDGETVYKFAQESCKKLLAYHPAAVLCQGEFTYCYILITLLKEYGVTVLSACSKRETKEWEENGKNIKKAIFTFVRFREYSRLKP